MARKGSIFCGERKASFARASEQPNCVARKPAHTHIGESARGRLMALLSAENKTQWQAAMRAAA